MTAALQTPAPLVAPRTVVRLRPAPRREPPFDDEIAEAPLVGRYDQRLPFATGPVLVSADDLTPPRLHSLPDARIFARRLLVGLIESADGRRSLNQLAVMLSRSVGRGLSTEFERAAATGGRHWLQGGTVRTLRSDEPADGVAEVCATIDVGPRVRAVALRLENRDGRWLCTRLHLG